MMGFFLALGWFCWEVVMSMLVFIVDRSFRRHHLDHLDVTTWLISTTPHLSRPSQITMLGGRLVTRPSVAANKLFAIPSCLVGSKFSLLHGQHMHSEFGAGPPSCLDLARDHPILLPSSGSSQSLTVIPSNAVVLDPLPPLAYSYFLPGYCIK